MPPLPSPTHEGFVEYLSDRKVSGWVKALADDYAVTIEVIVEGRPSALVKADIPREDLKEAGKGNGAHAFDYYFSTPVLNFRKAEAVQVRVLGDVFTLEPTSELVQVLSQAPDGETEGKLDTVTPPSAPSECGLVVGVKNGEIFGWATLAGKSENVFLTVDGVALGEAAVTGLPAEYGNEPNLQMRGFRLRAPSAMLDDTTRSVVGYNAATGRPIEGMTCQLLFERAPVVQQRPITPSAEVALIPPVPAKSLPDGGRKRVVIVAWDLAHNPVGRAFLLADMLANDHDVELVGPIFKYYGGKVWPPIAASSVRVNGFPVDGLDSLVSGAAQLSKTISCDLVIVGKPRLSSLLLGSLIRQRNGCPMILDVDDHEISFSVKKEPADFDEVKRAAQDDSPDFFTPQSDLWIRACENLIEEADYLTVSNVALRRRFGGIVVRHARDERTFNPRLYDRNRVRAEYGYTERDKVVLFLGTPRPHKGIFELANSLERLSDNRLALCVIGTLTDKRLAPSFRAYRSARIALHPDQPWSRLAELVNMADCVAILQDPANAIAEFQIPAKLTDSLALGVPVIATPVAPLDDLRFSNAITFVQNEEELDTALRDLAGKKRSVDYGLVERTLYLTEFSYNVNRARLENAIQAAGETTKVEYPKLDQVFRLLENKTGVTLPRLVARPPRSDRRERLTKGSSARDLIFLWKQNDSDIYGRRSDMLTKYLLLTGKVRRVIHFDAPISAGDLDSQAAGARGSVAHQGNLVYLNTVKRVLKATDTPGFVRRTFLFRSGAKPERAFGVELPPKDAYPEFVEAVMREEGVTEAPILWVSPIVFDYQAVADVVRPCCMIADLIDDQRTFPSTSERYRRQIEAAYESILLESDFAFANCTAVQKQFFSIRGDIHVIPNGAELFEDVETWSPDPEINSFPRPVIGYVGNLRDRVDLDLIGRVAESVPNGTIVLVGSAHGRPEVAELASRYANIRLLGPRPYDVAQRIIASLDVAIMPHLRNEQSDRMNPLKLYVYVAIGVPVVTTDVANIQDMMSYVTVATSASEFVEAVGKAVLNKKNKAPQAC